MRVLMPTTLEEACRDLAANPDAVPIAGGTDLMVHWPEHLEAHARTYLDLGGLDGLQAIDHRADALILGPLTTYWDVLCDERVCAVFPLLADAARQVGAVQIQARGTWAGNIVNASPAADGVPVLMAYDAEIELTSSAGAEWIALDAFYLGYKRMRRRPDQLITAIRLPVRTHDFQVFEKVGSRAAQAITKIGVAMTHSDAGWRIVANSVAETVRRCRALEGLVEAGQPVRSPDDLLPAIRTDVAPIDDIRSTAAYRERTLSRLVYHDLKGAGIASFE